MGIDLSSCSCMALPSFTVGSESPTLGQLPVCSGMGARDAPLVRALLAQMGMRQHEANRSVKSLVLPHWQVWGCQDSISNELEHASCQLWLDHSSRASQQRANQLQPAACQCDASLCEQPCTPLVASQLHAKAPGCTEIPLPSFLKVDRHDAWLPDACTDVSSVETSACSSDEDHISNALEHRTTVMFRNVPPLMSRDMLVELLDCKGYCCLYDLVYIPIHYVARTGIGYAFVNFTSPQHAIRCQKTFQGFVNWPVPHGDTACSVIWSQANQGLAAHVNTLRNSSIMHSSVPEMFRPGLFLNGLRVKFPPSTKRPRAPRPRQTPTLVKE